MVQGIWKAALHISDWHIFMGLSLGILNVFNMLTLKQVFLKIKTFIEKLEYSCLVQSTANEKATFPYKTALSKATVKTN